MKKTKKFYLILGAIASLGFILRIAVGMELYHNYSPVKTPSPETDMYTYKVLAQSILDGTYDFSQGFYYQPFYYTVFLPIVYIIGGIDSSLIIWFQGLLGALIIWLTGISFSRVFGGLSGVISALIVSLNRFLIF